MNNYITLDGYKYRTMAKDWTPIVNVPTSFRMTLSGKSDAAFAAGDIKQWAGTIEARVTPEDGFGSIDDLIASVLKRSPLSFTDHFGASYQVIVYGPMKQTSISPKWDGASNVYRIPVTLMEFVE